MFIGGLNWETTDRKSPQCNSPLDFPNNFLLRISQGLLHTIWRGHRVHSHARRRDWPLTWIRFPHLQGPQDCKHCHGEGALPRWKDRKLRILHSWGFLPNTRYAD